MSTDIKLPESVAWVHHSYFDGEKYGYEIAPIKMARGLVPLYTADQMRAAIAAERARCLRIVKTYEVSVGNSRAGELACEWTMEALREIEAEIRGEVVKARAALAEQPAQPVGTIRTALDHAASSLETIWRIAGRGDHMMEFSEVRAYAAARAEVARAALAEQPALPLTEDERTAIWKEAGIVDNARGPFMRGIQAAEQAHGIKEKT